MKSFKSFVTILVALLVFPSVSNAQFTSGWNGGNGKLNGDYYEIQFKGQLDSTAGTYVELTSQKFEVPNFSSLEYVNGSYDFAAGTYNAGNIFVNLLGSNSVSLATYPLLAQLVDTTTSVTYTNITPSTLSNVRPKYYKAYFKNGASGGDNATFDVILRFKVK
jgi:hypothetical protein